MMPTRLGALVLLGALIACGGNGTAKPVTELKVRDLRSEQARSRSPGDVLGPMVALTLPDRVIYGPPPDLTLHRGDSLLTAPFGITPRTDAPARPGGAADTSSGARRPAPAGADTAARRDTAVQAPPSPRPPR
ncbi:MAG TPA: hypothetical protein VK922_10045 [Gemmatimonadaceae bacterium]|nr:hypothetical protein [Gemmatimonadaceae bacterium]